MRVVNFKQIENDVVAEFELRCKELGTDDGFIQVTHGEYLQLMRHYGVKRNWPWQSWPIMNGVTVIPQAIAK